MSMLRIIRSVLHYVFVLANLVLFGCFQVGDSVRWAAPGTLLVCGVTSVSYGEDGDEDEVEEEVRAHLFSKSDGLKMQNCKQPDLSWKQNKYKGIRDGVV